MPKISARNTIRKDRGCHYSRGVNCFNCQLPECKIKIKDDEKRLPEEFNYVLDKLYPEGAM